MTTEGGLSILVEQWWERAGRALAIFEKDREDGMPSLEEATERLQKALQQLEAAAEGRRSGEDTLRADLRTAENDSKRLHAAIESVSDRLDQAIARVKQMMET